MAETFGAKNRSPLIVPVLEAIDKLHEATVEFQTAVANLADHGVRMRAMVDELQSFKSTIDDDGKVHNIPALFSRAGKKDEATG